jgi:hypothetical protein
MIIGSDLAGIFLKHRNNQVYRESDNVIAGVYCTYTRSTFEVIQVYVSYGLEVLIDG